MRRCVRQPLDAPDPLTGRAHGWTVHLDADDSDPNTVARTVRWQGLQTGPLTLDRRDLDAISRELLGCPLAEVDAEAEPVLRPAVGEKAELPAILLHSTTPDLRTFDGDLDALVHGGRGGDFTTYKEARSVYLGRPREPGCSPDLAVGRTRAWRAAVEALGAEAIELEDVDHYYLSHALLHLARLHHAGERPEAAGNGPTAMERLIEWVRAEPRQVRLYAFEKELQVFLLWLARAAGADELVLEANSPAISAAWNRKSVLHPTVAKALALDGHLPADPLARLALESRCCELAERMGIEVPALPGYTLEREGRSADDFVHQALAAADLLRTRHGLEKGCLKASESGDGARILPGLELDDRDGLARLARRAHVHGDDYVLEAHVNYGEVKLAGQVLPTALSAHIRGGAVAEGATLQFMEGTSWKGNVLIDAASCEHFGVPTETYERLFAFVHALRDAFASQGTDLVIAGIDFALGRVGGVFGDRPLLGVQDPNVSFTGAECLRAFLEKAATTEVPKPYGVTRIFRPQPHADHAAFLEITRQFCRDGTFADTVAAIPGRWGMVGITGADPAAAIGNLGRLQEALEAADLVQS